VINFEDAKSVPNTGPVGVRIQTRTENYHLANAAFDGNRQSILGKARPYSDEQPQPSSGQIGFCNANSLFGVGTENAKRQRVGKDTTLLQHLMSGAMRSGSQCSATWRSLQHLNNPLWQG
jgi:hypothetical protein